mgnify:FL=1
MDNQPERNRRVEVYVSIMCAATLVGGPIAIDKHNKYIITSAAQNAKISQFDFNNDGLDDIVLYVGEERVVFHNTGKGYRTKEQLLNAIKEKYSRENQVVTKEETDSIKWLDRRLEYGRQNRNEMNLHDTINTTNSRYDQMIKESRR